jgi:hypothetical protein
MKTLLNVDDHLALQTGKKSERIPPTFREMLSEAALSAPAKDDDHAMNIALLSGTIVKDMDTRDLELSDDQFKLLKELCARKGTGAPPDGPWYAHYYGQLVFKFRDAEMAARDAAAQKTGAIP